MPLNTASEEASHVRFCLKRNGGPASCPNIGNTFVLGKGTTIVGRNPAKSDIYLDSSIHKALISRLHARISVGCDNRVKICDTSLNGTYVNDRKILDTADINPGDTITFGHLKGAVLVPGTVARQPKSEFRFKLEKYERNHVDESTIDSGKENSQENIKKTDHTHSRGFIPNLSLFIRNNKTNSKDPDETGKRVAVADDSIRNGATDSSRSTADSDLLDFDNDDSDDDDDELLAFAVAARDAMDEESDPELFSVTMPYSAPDIGTSPVYSPESTLEKTQEMIQDENTNTCTNMALDVADGEGKTEDVAICEKTPKQEKSSKRSKRKSSFGSTKKRKHVKHPTGHEDPIPDMCAFGTDCLCPHNQHEIVNWVQCDYCQKWYHLECAGLTVDNVAGESRKFNCGCS